MKRLENTLGEHFASVDCTTDFAKASQNADVVMLGVPPGELRSLLEVKGVASSLEGKTIISLLAGVTCADIISALKEFSGDDNGASFQVLRAIPSMGALSQKSVTFVSKSSSLEEERSRMCDWIFGQIGEVIHFPESQMNEATAAGAVCHALACVAVDAVTDASVAEGLSRSTALSLAAKALASAAGMLADGMSPETLKESMSVPFGITTNAFLELDSRNVRSGISGTTRHAIKYARSMDK